MRWSGPPLVVECFCEQMLNLRQSKDGFRKRVELHFRQSLHRGSHAFHSGTTGNEPMGALSAFAFLTVGNAVFVLLYLVLKLGKLLFAGGPFRFQLGQGFLFWHF